jgi:hypothetical protein
MVAIAQRTAIPSAAASKMQCEKCIPDSKIAEASRSSGGFVEVINGTAQWRKWTKKQSYILHAVCGIG